MSLLRYHLRPFGSSQRNPQKRYSAVISYLKQAPPNPALQLTLAAAYSRNGDMEEALGILTKLAESEPESAPAHFNLASIYAHQKRFREAVDEYRFALRLNPSDDVTRISLVKALVMLAQYADA